MPYTNAKLKILVVEDNEGDFVLIEELLVLWNNNVKVDRSITFIQTKELLQINQYDLILLDLSLPDAKGEDLVKKIINLVDSVPVVVLTGYGDKTFGIKSLSLGVSDYLLKNELSKVQLDKCIAYSIERKKISIELKKSEEKYRELFHLSPVPMWVCDINTQRILSVNDAAIKNYGYSQDEFLLMTVKEIRYYENLNNSNIELISSQELCAGKYKHKKKNGDIIDVEIQANSIWLNNTEACLILATDITESLLYLNKIEEQNKKLRDIAWMQSHVVRAPLARILGLTDLLLKDIIVNEDNNAALLLIQNSAKELDKVVRDLISKTEKVDI